jgi:hypothetical protein
MPGLQEQLSIDTVFNKMMNFAIFFRNYGGERCKFLYVLN